MQFHYNYPHYYLPLERNQDGGRVSGKSLHMEPVLGIHVYLTVVLPHERTELLPKYLPLKQREFTGLVATWY